jgi:hypothetical protein
VRVELGGRVPTAPVAQLHNGPRFQPRSARDFSRDQLEAREGHRVVIRSNQ